MRKLIILGCSVAFSVSGSAFAQENKAEEAATQLDTILVTDGLTPVEQKKSGRAYTVITGEDLARSQVRYVADALRLVPGFAVSRTGSYGGRTQVRVRGGEGNHLLVLIDGVEASETSDGEFDFGSLQVENIDRIEVLRGPQSAFWGSNAMSGVVNVITKGGARNGRATTTVRTETGTDGTVLGNLSVSGGGERYDGFLGGTLRRTGGFNVSPYGTEDDGDRNAALNGKFTLDLSPDLTLDGNFRYMDRSSEYDPQDYIYGSQTYSQVIDGDRETATREVLGALGLTHVSLDGALTQKARLSATDTHRDEFADRIREAGNDGNRYNGTYQASYDFDTPGFLDASHTLTGGYEWQRETFRPSHLAQTFGRTAHSLVGEYRGEFLGQLFLNAGLRRDFNDAFADSTTFSLGAAWQIPDTGARLHASLGSAVTNPTFYEQFGYLPSTFTGNPDLKPEKSIGFDIGVEQKLFDERLTVDVTYFHQNLTDEIGTRYDVNWVSSPYNMSGKSRRSGVELSATVNLLDGLTATGTYTYTDSSQQTAAGAARTEEIRRPRHTGSLSTAYTFYEERARVFAEAVFNAHNLDTDFATYETVKLDAYTVVNAGGSFKVKENIEVYGRIENVFDEAYQDVLGYNMPGRTAFIGMKGTF